MTEPIPPDNDDARIGDHLANERTYLAWLRTGIATMSFGVVIARLRFIFPTAVLAPPSRGLVHAANIGLLLTLFGLLLTLFGLLAVVLAARRFVVVQKQVRENRFMASTGTILTLSGIVAALGLLILWYLLDSSLR